MYSSSFLLFCCTTQSFAYHRHKIKANWPWWVFLKFAFHLLFKFSIGIIIQEVCLSPCFCAVSVLFWKSSELHKFMFMNVCSSSFIELISPPISPAYQIYSTYQLFVWDVYKLSMKFMKWSKSYFDYLKIHFHIPQLYFAQFCTLSWWPLSLGPLSSSTSCCFSSFLYWSSTSERFFFADTKMRVL